MKSFILNPRDDGCHVYYRDKVSFINGTPEKVCVAIIQRIKDRYVQFCSITIAKTSEAFCKYIKILDNNGIAYDCILPISEEEMLKELFVKEKI